MAFDETRKCDNCLFQLILEDQLKRCRFNAPMPRSYMANAEDMTRYNVTRFPRCPGPACGQWQAAEEPDIIEPEIELPNLIEKE